MFESLNKKQKIIFFIILSIMLLFIIYYIYINLYKDENTNLNNEFISFSSDDFIENNETETSNLNSENNSITVYICGEVKENKVITLKENSRIIDAIDSCGGLTDNADLTTINLAYILEDGEKIYIPKKGEILEDINFDNKNNSINTKTNKININKATQTELETIPGIGSSTAFKIIKYREENGKFSKIEDIKNVSGIGDSKFQNMKDYISVK